MTSILATTGLLVASNLFMTLAWYGHLRFKAMPLAQAILLSWGVAFFEYCLQVPANRLGYRTLSAYHLKMLQEVITLSVFVLFAHGYLGEGLRPKHLLGFVLLLAAAWVIFQDRVLVSW